jgi:hypothetical protein
VTSAAPAGRAKGTVPRPWRTGESAVRLQRILASRKCTFGIVSCREAGPGAAAASTRWARAAAAARPAAAEPERQRRRARLSHWPQAAASEPRARGSTACGQLLSLGPD